MGAKQKKKTGTTCEMDTMTTKSTSLQKIKSASESTRAQTISISVNKLAMETDKKLPELPISPILEEQMNQSSTENLYENEDGDDNEHANLKTPQPSPAGTYQEYT